MKEIVKATDGWFCLSDNHIEWLKQHGVSDATASTYENDRSNPLLLECVKAVEVAPVGVVKTACTLYNNVQKSNALSRKERDLFYSLRYTRQGHTDYDAGRAIEFVGVKNTLKSILDGEFDALAKSVRHQLGVDSPQWLYMNAGERRYQFMVHQREMVRECVNADVSVDDFIRIAEIMFGDPKDELDQVKNWYSDFYSFWKQNGEQCVLCEEMSKAYYDYLETNCLMRKGDTYLVDTSLEVVEYDDTLFDARIVQERGDYEDVNDDIGDYEHIVLTPYVTKDTICAYVANGDADGLLNHLKALRSNICIKSA